MLSTHSTGGWTNACCFQFTGLQHSLYLHTIIPRPLYHPLYTVRTWKLEYFRYWNVWTELRQWAKILQAHWDSSKQSKQSTWTCEKIIWIPGCRIDEVIVYGTYYYIRPHLEFAACAWSPKYEKDKQLIEGVLRVATKCVPGLRVRHLVRTWRTPKDPTHTKHEQQKNMWRCNGGVKVHTWCIQ